MCRRAGGGHERAYSAVIPPKATALEDNAAQLSQYQYEIDDRLR
jgi:hypothetical protein